MRDGNFKMLARLEGVAKAQNLHQDNHEKYRSAALTDFQLFDVTKDLGEKNDLFDPEDTHSLQLKTLMLQNYEELVDGSHVW